MPTHLRVRTVHIDDPKQTIWDKVNVGGDLDAIQLWGHYVLVGIYIRPATHSVKSNLQIPEDVVDDDRYQGKVGLVLKTGPRAYINNERDYPMRMFDGLRADPGEWVAFRASDGLKTMVGDADCRLIPDSNIRAVLDHPDAMF